MTDKPHIQTQIVQAEIGSDPAFGAVAPPLYTSSTYLWPSVEEKGPYDYGRTANPNRAGLSKALSILEGGSSTVITSSGMSAIDLCLNLIKADDLIIAPHDCYGGTHRLLTHRAAQGRVRVLFIDQSDPEALHEALDEKPAMVLIETPSNPLMRLVDISKIAKLSKACGAIVVADNTFLSPVRQQPLSLGCDIVVHSTTKYLNGHSDVVGGAVIAKSAEHGETLAWWANCAGVTGSPFDAWQTLRGLRTLSARMDIQESNAEAIAKYLKKHKAVTKVYYPGLRSDPGYKLMKAQQSGPGAMLSFELETPALAAKALNSIEIFQLAASLGGVESLICQPSTMTHRGMAESARLEAGITDNLLRLSVGMETENDLIKALDKALS
ncbi:cystathionine gamma-synthase [Litorimonas taeanensis]|uniref:Cystathionine gamma-synthase n=1 Tax=Litorimonas taeanensis TaxID=568099 RepID=A0A420WE64_9PROT|nr:cystathionine gamma-synthase [Litorimonas taeanensis]RKQ69314.1 cystathionine gamma-synthase [Litorimonas taeanensis]